MYLINHNWSTISSNEGEYEKALMYAEQSLEVAEKLNHNLEKHVYRIVQELVANAIKHGKSSEIMVQLMQINRDLHLTVEDNGKGFDPEKIADGLGLRSIKSRINLLGGRMGIESNPAKGSSFLIAIPINEKG
jgi:signal transduction histidine kinase